MSLQDYKKAGKIAAETLLFGKKLIKEEVLLKDVTKKIEMPFTLLGVMDHPRGGKVAGITSEFVIDRNVYGVGTGDWVSDAVVGKEVTATLNLELNSK